MYRTTQNMCFLCLRKEAHTNKHSNEVKTAHKDKQDKYTKKEETSSKKNMKIKHGHGQILVSGALDPRKMISQKIPEKSEVFSLKNRIFRGIFGLAGVENSWSIAEIR